QHAAATGCFLPASRTTETEWLASHVCRHRMVGVHADRVHHPGHDLRVGIDVGCWDIPIGTDQDADLAGVAAGQVLQLVTAQPLGIHDHSTLGSAVGDPDHGA